MIYAIESRLKRLEQGASRDDFLAFQVEGGGTYTPKGNPFAFLSEYDGCTPDGRKLVGVVYRDEGADPITRAIIETLEGVVDGTVPSMAATVAAMEQAL